MNMVRSCVIVVFYYLLLSSTFFLFCHGFGIRDNEISNSDDLSYDPDNPTLNENGTLPIVLWHGMGDTAVGVKHALRFLSQDLPGVFIESLQLGSNIAEDMKNGYFWNVNEQIDMACRRIGSLEPLKHGYNAIGLSQGAQFLRGLAQRCPSPRMRNLISLGGQHQGIFGLPHCSAPKASWCERIDRLLSKAAYSAWVQERLVQAEYWHDPFREEEFQTKSIFLADINNERIQNEEYKKNLQKLENLVLVKFEEDTMVEPKESEWFGYFAPGDDKTMMTLQESKLYQEDRLGLKALEAAGKLHFLSVPGDHLQFTKEWFRENVMRPFLVPLPW